MGKQKKAIWITLGVIIIIALIEHFTGGAPQGSLKPYEALGQVAGEETAKLIGGSGQIVLIVPDLTGIVDPQDTTEIEAFRKAIQATPGVSIVSTQVFNSGVLQTKRSPGLKFFEPLPPGSQPTEGQITQVLTSNPDLKALVYLVGLPPLTDGDVAALTQHGTKLVAVSRYMPDYKMLFQSKVLQLAIIPRFEPPPDSGKPRNLKEWFDKSYLVITPDEAGDLP